jgi:hypothetical protein
MQPASPPTGGSRLVGKCFVKQVTWVAIVFHIVEFLFYQTVSSFHVTVFDELRLTIVGFATNWDLD